MHKRQINWKCQSINLPICQSNYWYRTWILVAVVDFDIPNIIPRGNSSHQHLQDTRFRCNLNIISVDFSNDLNFLFFECNSIASISVLDESIDQDWLFFEWNYCVNRALWVVHTIFRPAIRNKFTGFFFNSKKFINFQIWNWLPYNFHKFSTI